MLIPTTGGTGQIEIKKSIFISQLSFIKSAEEARTRVKSLWQEHPQARHIVWAYRLGEQGQIEGRSDDGEPSGTAGNPTLSVLKNRDVTAALITTIRYFGGVKLGTGGLVRAYTESAQKALQSATLQTWVEKKRATLSIPYPLYDSFINFTDKNECQRLQEEFTDQIKIVLEYPATAESILYNQIKEWTNGEVLLKGSPCPSPFENLN